MSLLRTLQPTATSRRRARITLMLTTLLLALVTLFAPSSMAGPFECEQAPAPEQPGQGIVGQLDPAPIGVGTSGSPYDVVGYAGLVWHTYGVSGPCAVTHPAANTDTYLGGQFFNIAKVVVAATNGLHYAMQDGGMLADFDGIIVQFVTTMYDGVYVPYLGLALTLVAIAILAWTTKGDLARTGRKVMWVIIGMWVASATYLTPLVYTNIADQVLIDGTAQLHGSILRSLGQGDPRDGPPTLLHNEIVYKPWLTGEFGDPTSPQAQRYGEQLMRAQACTKNEVLDDSCDVEAKKKEFTRIADELQDTPAYSTFQGVSANRAGIGFFAAIKACCYAVFQLICKAGILLAQIIIRLVVMAGPVLGLVGILRNDVLPGVFRSIGNALGQGLLLALAGAAHTYLLTIILRNTGFSSLEQFFIITSLTAVGWVSLRPLWRLREMGASTVGITLPSFSQHRMTQSMRRSRRGGQPGIGGKLDQLVERIGRSQDPKPSQTPHRGTQRPETTETSSRRKPPTSETEADTVPAEESSQRPPRRNTSSDPAEDSPPPNAEAKRTRDTVGYLEDEPQFRHEPVPSRDASPSSPHPSTAWPESGTGSGQTDTRPPVRGWREPSSDEIYRPETDLNTEE